MTVAGGKIDQEGNTGGKQNTSTAGEQAVESDNKTGEDITTKLNRK